MTRLDPGDTLSFVEAEVRPRRRKLDFAAGIAIAILAFGALRFPIVGHLVGLIAVGFSRAWIRVDKIVAVAIVAILWALPFVILLLVRFEGDSALALIVFPASAGLIASIWLVVAWLVRRT